MPEAYEHGGNLVGVMTTLGSAIAYATHVLDCVGRPTHRSRDAQEVGSF